MIRFREITGIEIELPNGGWTKLVKICKRINKTSFATDAQFYFAVYDWCKNSKAFTRKMFVYIMANCNIKYKGLE